MAEADYLLSLQLPVLVRDLEFEVFNQLLIARDYRVPPTGLFDLTTNTSTLDFHQKQGLTPEGKVAHLRSPVSRSNLPGVTSHPGLHSTAVPVDRKGPDLRPPVGIIRVVLPKS